jgi:hypothetical protein
MLRVRLDGRIDRVYGRVPLGPQLGTYRSESCSGSLPIQRGSVRVKDRNRTLSETLDGSGSWIFPFLRCYERGLYRNGVAANIIRRFNFLSFPIKDSICGGKNQSEN